jgi:hypothetical protein
MEQRTREDASGHATPRGDALGLRRIALAVIALLVAMGASAQAVRQECKGILHRDQNGLSFRVPPEGLCEIDPSQAGKVLATCTPGRFCRVEGIAEDCKDTGECSEITHVLSVRRR